MNEHEHLIDSIDEAYRKIKEHENKTSTKFSIHAVRSKDFGSGELYSKKGNSFIHWFDKLPYIFLNQQLFDCKYGPDRHITFKAEMKRKNESKTKSDHSQATKSKKMIQCSRKLGCPAKISLKEVITFPDFIIPINNLYNKNKASKILRELMQQKEATGIKKYILTLPASESEHQMHPVGEGSEVHQTLDEKVRLKITELVGDAVTGTADIKSFLHQYVTKELFSDASELPSQSNRRFFPSSEVIRNIVKRTLRKLSYSSNEQEIKGVYISTNLKQNSTEMNTGLANDDEGEEEVAIPTSRTTTQQENDPNEETEKPVEQVRSLSIEGAKVREMLAEIRTLSYEINDLSEMESLKNRLEPVLKYVSKKTVNQKGFTVSQNKEVKLTNKRKKSNHLNKNSENEKNLGLPLRKKRYTSVKYNKFPSPVSNFNKHDPSNNVVIDGTFDVPKD